MNSSSDTNNANTVHETAPIYLTTPLNTTTAAHRFDQHSTEQRDSTHLSKSEVEHALSSLAEYRNNPKSALLHAEFKKWLRRSRA